LIVFLRLFFLPKEKESAGKKANRLILACRPSRRLVFLENRNTNCGIPKTPGGQDRKYLFYQFVHIVQKQSPINAYNHKQTLFYPP